MNSIAQYVMQSRRNAIMLALGCTFFQYIAFIGVIIMSLVTLRKGAKEGFMILLWISLPNVVMGFAGHPQMIINNVIFGGVLTWGLALILRHAISWKTVIEAAALLGIIGVVLAHAYIPNLHQYWVTYLMLNLKAMSSTLNITKPSDLHAYVTWAARFATGFQMLFLLASALLNLAFARWMQANLYNPGGLRQELFAVKMDWIAVVVLFVIMAAIYSGSVIALDLLALALLPFVLSGLSLIHHLAEGTKAKWLWLVSFYGLLVASFPYLLGLVILSALLDCFINVRQRVRPQTITT